MLILNYSNLNTKGGLFRKKLSNSENRTCVSDVFVKLRKATVSFIMPVRPSLRMEQLDRH